MVVGDGRRVTVAIGELFELAGGLVLIRLRVLVRIRERREPPFGAVRERPRLRTNQVGGMQGGDEARLGAAAGGLHVPEGRLVPLGVGGAREATVRVVGEGPSGRAVVRGEDVAGGVVFEGGGSADGVARRARIERGGV